MINHLPGPAAVDTDILSGDESGFVGVEIQHNVYYSEPLIEYAPESNACEAYEKLAGEVIAYEG